MHKNSDENQLDKRIINGLIAIMLSSLPLRVLLVGLLASFGTHALHGIQLADPRNARHDRFLNADNSVNQKFLFFDYDPSGIAINQNTLANAGRATMISPRHFVTSTHTSGTHPQTVTFLGSDGVQRTYSVSHYTQVGTSDLTIGTLTTAIPAADKITFYPVASNASSSYTGAMIGLFGMQQLAGINRLESATTVFSHNFNNGSGTRGRGGDEAAPTTGDSGHAAVAAYNGRLYLVGTHTTTVGGPFIPSMVSAINAILQPEGYSLTVESHLPRQIADFTTGKLWSDAGTAGGTQSVNTVGSSIGRVGSAISHHHLYAPTSAARPVLAADESRTALRFSGTQRLIAKDTDADTAQAFMFELNTEQPRITLAVKLDALDSGVGTLLEIEYVSKSLLLSYDHTQNLLSFAGLGTSVSLAAPEAKWISIEAIWEAGTLGLALNGGIAVTSPVGVSFYANTDFNQLAIGSRIAGTEGMHGLLGRVIFTDTGLVRDEAMLQQLHSQFGIVPEPSSVILMGIGMGFLLCARFPRRAGNKQPN